VAAPLVATFLLAILLGGMLLVVLGILGVLAGHPLKLYGFRFARSVATLAVVGGYFLWNGFASPDSVALTCTAYLNERDADRKRRRWRVAVYVLLVAAMLWLLSG
jgi:hypothetical protein